MPNAPASKQPDDMLVLFAAQAMAEVRRRGLQAEVEQQIERELASDTQPAAS